jgi:hypothetical protein
LNCPPYDEGEYPDEWWCRDCIAYELGNLDEKAGTEGRLEAHFNLSQFHAFEKMVKLKEDIREGRVFEVDGKSYVAYETIGKNVKGSDE